MFFCCTLILVTSSALAAVTSIKSGTTWLDNNGEPVNAHGGGIWFENGKYYLYGEHFSGGTNDFKAMAMYSSTDLMN
ncbi:MAG: hypothetical protein ABIW76_13260, partial [Fibrobacteria bacterium]